MAVAAVIAGATLPTVLRWLRRTGAARRSVDMRMTVVVERSINDVFAFCHNFENFPRIMDVLLSVEDTEDGRSHWAVRSPTGQTVEWDATITKYVPNSVIAWESVPGSEVQATGLMRFAPLSPTETRVDISLTYRPCRTDFADAMRALIGSSNTKRLRADLTQASHALSGAMAPLSPAEPEPAPEPEAPEAEAAPEGETAAATEPASVPGEG